MDNINNIFWLEDLRVLYRNESYLDVFPKYEMTRIQQLNSITRLCILIMFILLMTCSYKYLYIPFWIIGLVLIIYFLHARDKKSEEKETIRQQEIKNEQKEIKQEELNKINIDTIREEKKIKLPEELKTVSQRDPDIIKYIDPEESQIIRDNIKKTCKKPSNDNPFMNPSFANYENNNLLTACNVDDEDIKTMIHQNFTDNLFRDTGDLWDKFSSDRQFYTLPNTQNPNDQKQFAEWCYKQPDTCKQNQEHCLKYEDLRYKS
jgi:hypothetical protein